MILWILSKISNGLAIAYLESKQEYMSNSWLEEKTYTSGKE